MKKAMERPIAKPEPESLTPYPACVLKLLPVVNMTDDQFLEFCHLNGDLRMERTSKGELIIMPPTCGETGSLNSELNCRRSQKPLRMQALPVPEAEGSAYKAKRNSLAVGETPCRCVGLLKTFPSAKDNLDVTLEPYV